MFEEMGMDHYLLRTKKLLETLDGEDPLMEAHHSLYR